jgi:hypothetical protein
MSGSLVLNATYEPLGVVSARRAVVLVLDDKAEVIHTNGATFRSERLSIDAPSVIGCATSCACPTSAGPRSTGGRCSARQWPVPVLRQEAEASITSSRSRGAAHLGERRGGVPPQLGQRDRRAEGPARAQPARLRDLNWVRGHRRPRARALGQYLGGGVIGLVITVIVTGSDRRCRAPAALVPTHG